MPSINSQLFFYTPYTLSTTIISISLSLHLVLLAPVNSCELHNYYLVLSLLLMYSSSGLSTDVFSNKTNINTLLQALSRQVTKPGYCTEDSSSSQAFGCVNLCGVYNVSEQT